MDGMFDGGAAAGPQAGGRTDRHGQDRGSTWRRWVAGFLLLLAAWGIVYGLAGLWGRGTFLNAEGFADMTDRLLAQPAIRDGLTNAIASKVIGQIPADQRQVDEVQIRQAIGAAVASPEFSSVLHQALANLHNAIFESNEAQTALNLTSALPTIANKLKELDPRFGKYVPTDAQLSQVASIRQGLSTIRSAADSARTATLLLPLFGIICAIAGFALHPRRPSAMVTFGIEVAILAGVVLVMLLAVPPLIEAVIGTTQTPDVIPEAWSAVTSTLRTWMLLCVVGGVAAAIAGYTIGRARRSA